VAREREQSILYESPQQVAAGNTARNFLSKAPHHKQTYCNSNAWQHELGFTLEFVDSNK
jgi:hypothetical protein